MGNHNTQRERGSQNRNSDCWSQELLGIQEMLHVTVINQSLKVLYMVMFILTPKTSR